MKFVHAVLLALSLLLSLLSSVAIAGLDEGYAAYKNQGYVDETALREFKAALPELKRLATQGDARAQFFLGLMYKRGDGVTQSDTEAVKWYRLAADQGNADAQFFLGLMYSAGIGVTQDKNEALKWHELAAAQGYAKAKVQIEQDRQIEASLRYVEDAKREWDESIRKGEELTKKRIEEEHKAAAAEEERKAEKAKNIMGLKVALFIGWSLFLALFYRFIRNPGGLDPDKVDPDFQSTVIDIPNNLKSQSPELLESLKDSAFKSKARIPLVIALIAQILSNSLFIIFWSANFAEGGYLVTARWAWIVSAVLGVWAIQCVSKSIKIGLFKKLSLMGLMLIPPIIPLPLLLTLYFISHTENQSRAMSPQSASVHSGTGGRETGGGIGGRAIAGLAFMAIVIFASEAALSDYFVNRPERVYLSKRAENVGVEGSMTLLRLKGEVLSRLKDPDSAKFGNLVFLNLTKACIPVNAKNSYGGYTGEKYFSLTKDASDKWAVDDGDAEFNDSLCRLNMSTR